MSSNTAEVAARIDALILRGNTPDEENRARANIACRAVGDTKEQQVADTRHILDVLGLLPGQPEARLVPWTQGVRADARRTSDPEHEHKPRGDNGCPGCWEAYQAHWKKVRADA